MTTIYEIENIHLNGLNPQEAVAIFRELLWAEARRIRLELSKIHISNNIYVPDGGVDASVEENGEKCETGLIKPGYTTYQIKASVEFSPWQNAEIRKELFGTKDINLENLAEGVKNCLDRDGTYILVCFKKELTSEQVRIARECITTHLVSCGYQNPKVEVWGQNNIVSFLRTFPSLALTITGRGELNFQSHKSWSQEAEMRREFQAGQPQKEFIASIQNALRKDAETTHIRVLGEPGIGKTRLILEATREEDLKPLVIYCDSAYKFRDSDLINEILKEDNQFSSILVIDECDPDSKYYIWNKLKHCGPRLKLISIYNDYDDTTGTINYLNAPPLDKEQLIDIIHSYGVPKDQAVRWIEFCSGSPRVAHVIGENLKYNPEDLLRPPETSNVWDRYIVGRDDPGSRSTQQRRLVLRHIALFKRFGIGGSAINEAQAIAKIVELSDPQITWQRFIEIIQELRKRKILQGEATLYITPKMFHIKLWVDFWETYGEGFNLEEFITRLPETLREWFNEMFKYASGSNMASRIVKELLAEEGPFGRIEYLKKKDGASFFSALSESDPESALKCLKRLINPLDREELLLFETGRREVIWSLERIAIWQDLFPDAARLLLKLAEAENESWSNNASGVFADLFCPGYGKGAATEASPQERFPILKEALNSPSKERRNLALRACDKALESGSFTRRIGPEWQGLRKEPQLWTPQTYGELFDAYRIVWRFLEEKLDELPPEEQQRAVDIILNRARGIGMIQNLADMVIKTVVNLAHKPYVDKNNVLAKVVSILHYDGKALPPETRKQWEALKNDLTGTDFSSLMKRHVALDLLEDKFDEEGNRIDNTQATIKSLAEQAIENEALLEPELSWLVTTEAQKGFQFGYELGRRNKNFSLLPKLLEVQQDGKDNLIGAFLGGYFRALFEKDRTKWEEQLEIISKDRKLNVWVPELTWRSGMSDQAALRVLRLAQSGAIEAHQFRMFCYGSVIRELSEEVFQKWINFLLESPDSDAIFVAIDLYGFYYVRKDPKYPLPGELTFKLLTHKSLLHPPTKDKRNQMDEYHWTEIGKRFVQNFPQKSLELAGILIKHFGEEGTIFESFFSQTQTVLNEIIRQYPSEVWGKLTEYLGPPIDTRAYYLKEWLRGGEHYPEKGGTITYVPLENLWKWVKGDIEKRAWYLASFVPKALFRKEGRICLAREVLVKYGTRDDVKRALFANFSSEGWSGPESLHYQQKRQELVDFKKGEDNYNVISWIDEYLAIIDKRIERAKFEEERRGF